MSSFMFAFGSGVLLLTVIIALPLLIGRRSTGSGSEPGKVSPWIVGIGIVLIVGFILYNFVDLPDSKSLKIDIGFWIALIAILGLAVAKLFFKNTSGAGTLAVWVVGIVIFMLLIFGDNITDVRKSIKDGATSVFVEKKSTKTEQQSLPASKKPEIATRYVTIPAGGTVNVQRVLRCNVDTISDADMVGIERVDSTGGVKYTSKLSVPVTARVTFFDARGSCSDDVVTLISDGIIK